MRDDSPGCVDGALVEVLDRTEVVGWVALPADADPVLVDLCVDEHAVASSWTTESAQRHAAGAVRAFRFPLRDIWDYVTPDNRLSICVGGRPIPIAGEGLFTLPPTAGTGTPAELHERLAGGEVFTTGGRLRMSMALDSEWQRAALNLYASVRHALRDCGVHDLFLAYGTLLGAVRDGSFIGDDLEFDCAYISTHHDGARAADELRDLAFALVDRGYAVQATPDCLQVRATANSDVALQIFHLYFGVTGALHFPFGVAGMRELGEDEWNGVVDTEFIGKPVLVPASAEALLATIYGPDWRDSKPGFRWNAERVDRADSGRLPAAAIEEVYWTDFYSRTTYTRGSTFFDLIQSRPDVPPAVVDLGCGDGRDSFAFAAAGRRVVGLDRSGVGVQQATRRAELAGWGNSLCFVRCDVSVAEHLRAALRDARGDGSSAALLFYARFFLHSLPEDTQRVVLEVISECARPGDCFAAEFRTDRDESQAKVHGSHYRRFQNGAAFGKRLRDQYGFTVVMEQEGNGMSPYGDEDPELYRVFARRSD